LALIVIVINYFTKLELPITAVKATDTVLHMHPNKINYTTVTCRLQNVLGLWPKLLWLHQSITHIQLFSKRSISEDGSSDICTLKTLVTLLTSTSIRFHT